jgi:hypothetical protein
VIGRLGYAAEAQHGIEQDKQVEIEPSQYLVGFATQHCAIRPC